MAAAEEATRRPRLETTEEVVAPMAPYHPARIAARAAKPLLEPASRDALTAYSEGVNAYLADRSPSQLSAEYAVDHAAELERKVYPVPDEIDREIARLKLDTMGIRIDRLTQEQANYLASWNEGT